MIKCDVYLASSLLELFVYAQWMIEAFQCRSSKLGNFNALYPGHHCSYPNNKDNDNNNNNNNNNSNSNSNSNSNNNSNSNSNSNNNNSNSNSNDLGQLSTKENYPIKQPALSMVVAFLFNSIDTFRINSGLLWFLPNIVYQFVSYGINLTISYYCICKHNYKYEIYM